MKKVYILLAPGFEETEAILPYDILHRARVEVQFVSVNGEPYVTSSHGVPVGTSLFLAESNLMDGDMLFLPGGMPGSINLRDSEAVDKVVRAYDAAGKWLAAVCAAPMVLGVKGLLEGQKATCYPGFEKDLAGAEPQKKTCVRSGHFITGCGAGAGFALGREMAAVLVGEDTADAVLRQMMYQVYE
jgi:4-methyl-5(b-hydroxyethyl)-thiazole monophosphate biosynthesis